MNPLDLGKTDQEDDMPVVAPAELTAVKDLQSVYRGMAAGYAYNLMATGDGRLIIFVNLLKNTDMHVVTLGDKSRSEIPVQKLINSKYLQEVELEGNFPDYFKVYCTPDKDIELREIFTPDVMQGWANFCRTYDLEIFYDSIYVSQAADAEQKGNETTLMGDVTDFLTKNSAVLSRLSGNPSTPV